jgi:hypothetical protein
MSLTSDVSQQLQVADVLSCESFPSKVDSSALFVEERTVKTER